MMGSNSKRKALLSSEESRRPGGSGRRVKAKMSPRSGLRRQEDASRAAQTAHVTASTAKHVDEQRQDSGPVGVSRRSPPDLRKRKDIRTLGALKSSEGKVRDVIERVLWEEGRPLAAPAIAKLALERGYMTQSTMTPEATIRSAMSRELKLPASEAKFAKTATGEYAMKEWGTEGGFANNDGNNDDGNDGADGNDDGADVETDDAATGEMVKIRRILQSSADGAKKRGGRKRGAGGWSDGGLASLAAASTQEDGLSVGVTQNTLKTRRSANSKKHVPLKTRRAASGVLINGKMVHSTSGVPDKFLLDMASMPLDERPKRCGQCNNCQNLERKRACEVMRALAAIPPNDPTETQPSGSADRERENYKRIHHVHRAGVRRGGRVVSGWDVLLPTKGALWMLVAKLPERQRVACYLYPLGAVFPSAEMAARAADRALIAMSGRLASSTLLNWPLEQYPESTCYQRFGSDLVRYLQGIVAEGRAEMEAAKGQDLSERGVLDRDWRLRQKMAAMILKEDPVYRAHMRPCGTCQPCKSAGSTSSQQHGGDFDRCMRMRTLRDHVLLEAEGVEMRAYREAIKAAEASGDVARSDRLVHEAVSVALPLAPPLPASLVSGSGRNLGNTSAGPSSSGASSLRSRRRQMPALDWVVDPTGKMGVDTNVAAPSFGGLKLAQDVAELRSRVLASTKRHAWEMPLRRPFPGAGPSSRPTTVGARESSSLPLVRICKWCGGTWHGPKGQKRCPLLQAALALPGQPEPAAAATAVTNPACATCNDEPGSSCGACMRGNAGLPSEAVELMAPLRGEPGCADWANRLSPAMLDLALSIRGLANAAISDFHARHLTAQLTPDVLMNLLKVADALIDDAVRQARAGRE